MSRIIVKNLPATITEKKLREIFEEKGFVTDLQLKYNKAGVFRKFAFVGYKTEDEAQAAKEYFNNTFIFTSKIQVENCSNLNDPNKPKPWKEFLKEKAKIKEAINIDSNTNSKSEKGKKTKVDDIPEELKQDTQFKEFLAVNVQRTSKPLWADDIAVEDEKDSESSNDDGYETTRRVESEHEKSHEDKHHKEREEQSIDDKKELQTISAKKVKIHNDLYTVKLRKLPYIFKKKQIKEFFRPLKILSLRIPPRNKGYIGFAYVGFKTEKDMNVALNRNGGFLAGHRIDVIRYARKDFVDQNEDKKVVNEKNTEKDMELLAEVGRIYARNLCYSVTEEDIEKLFSQYGELAEVHVPIDLLTKKAQGIAFVSYVFAEHAVRAFSELDGTIFQGRLLHLIPAKPKREIVIDGNETNYKKKKEAKLKSLSGSSHNWNILFMGMNAVAEVIAEKYNVEKSKLLSGDSNESVAVRMALAETQVVMETRKFLIENGVQLDAFSQPAAERSKTVIVVKHLPAKTSSVELNELFSKHGTISRIILPPSGLAALIEFQDPSEAKIAFKQLAYTRFHHLPLFLEWAPINSVKDPPRKADDSGINESLIKEDNDETAPATVKPEQEEEPAPGTTIFVKNLNFCTTQENFKKHFEQCGKVYHATISTKKNIKSGQLLSMGFGFVQYKKKSAAMKAIQNLQLSKLDGHALELKFSKRAVESPIVSQRKRAEMREQKSAKILVRNLPFEVSEKEVRDLFKEFGILKSVRLPKKMGNIDEHRGFGFIEYMTKSDAKRAFEALCHSTHFLNRRLVLEWANPDAEDVDELRKKTARDFLNSGPRAKLKKSKLKEDVALASARAGPEE